MGESVWRTQIGDPRFGRVSWSNNNLPIHGEPQEYRAYPAPADARRDRIVRAAEAWVDAFEDGQSLLRFAELTDLRAAVAAAREANDA